jgi:curved DNA-binding protein CbpA
VALDPYFQLGIEPGADAKTIKAAYRRKARETHPDRNPDDPRATTRFQLVQEAYDILSDPVRRASYDETGNTERDSGESLAISLLAGAVIETIKQSDAQGVMADPRFSLVDTLRDFLRQIRDASRGRKRSCESLISGLERQLKRMKFKGDGSNLVKDIIDEQIARARIALEKESRHLVAAEAALKIMEQYEGLPPEDLFNAMQRFSMLGIPSGVKNSAFYSSTSS